jgi:hypothetical protein
MKRKRYSVGWFIYSGNVGIYCENGKSVHIPGNFRQIGPLFAFKFPKICPQLAILSLQFPKSDRLLERF